MAIYVPFLTVESNDDLIVSFPLGLPAERSLTLLRTPKYEALVGEEERGVSVGTGSSDTLERELLVSVHWGAREVTLESTHETYVLDIHAVAPDEVRRAEKVLRQMNFDNRFLLSGV